MSNVYSQFNLRGRTANPVVGEASPPTVGWTNVPNVANPLFGSIRLRLSSAGQKVPMMPVAGAVSNVNYCTPTAGHQQFVLKYNTGVGVLPTQTFTPKQNNSVLGIVPGQPFIPYRHVNVPHDSSVRLYAPGPASTQLQSYAAAAAMMNPNRLPMIVQPAAPLRQICPPNQRPVSLLGGILPSTSNAAFSASAATGAGVPFRQVRWIPPSGNESSRPDVPFVWEIKPEGDEPVQPRQPFANSLPMLNGLGAGHAGLAQPASPTGPAVYLDIAMDGSALSEHNVKREDGSTSVASRPDDGRRTGPAGVDEGLWGVSGGKRRIALSTRGAPRGAKSRRRTRQGASCAESAFETCVVSSESNSSTESLSSEDRPEALALRERSEDDEEASDADEMSSPVPPELPTITEIVHVAAPPPRITSDTDQLIASDEDIGSDDEPESNLPATDGSGKDVHLDDSEGYVVMQTTRDMMFEMECDGKADDGEVLRVLLPSSKVASSSAKPPAKTKRRASPERPLCPRTSRTRSAINLHGAMVQSVEARLTDEDSDDEPLQSVRVSSPSASEVTASRRDTPPSASEDADHPAAGSSTEQPKDKPSSSSQPPVQASSNSDDVVIIEDNGAAQRIPPSAISLLTRSTVTNSVNCLLCVAVQSSFFRFDTQSSEVFRLLSLQREAVPPKVLRVLTDLVASVVDSPPDSEQLSSAGVVGDRRTLMYQCLFCPYGEMSAKRVVAHVKLQHTRYTPFLHSRLLPATRVQLLIYCRHCNFVAYDNAVMWIHFVTFHNAVTGHLPRLSKPTSPSWAPVLDPKQRAKKFPFYCCPECRYVDVVRQRIVHHVLTRHSFRSVFLGCVVRLVMVGHAAQLAQTPSYESFATESRFRDSRREIFVCVGCRFFSYYPTYAFNHYVVRHHSVQMMYACANSPLCAKQCATLEDIVTHIQSLHVPGRANQQQPFKCTVTLLDGVTATQLNIGRGMLTSADVPRHIQRSASVGPVPADQIVLDDDEDDGNDTARDKGDVSDDDIVLLSPHSRDIDEDDVEPDSHSAGTPATETCTSGSSGVSASGPPTEKVVTNHGPTECGDVTEKSSRDSIADDVVCMEVDGETATDENWKERSVIPVETVSLDSVDSSPVSESVLEPDTEANQNNHGVEVRIDDNTSSGRTTETGAEDSKVREQDTNNAVEDEGTTTESHDAVSVKSRSNDGRLPEQSDTEVVQERTDGTDETDHFSSRVDHPDQLSDTAEVLRESECADISPSTECDDSADLLAENPSFPAPGCSTVTGDVADQDKSPLEHISASTQEIQRRSSLLPEHPAVLTDDEETSDMIHDDISTDFQLFNADSALSEVVRVFPEGLCADDLLSELDPATSAPDPDGVEEDELLGLSDELSEVDEPKDVSSTSTPRCRRSGTAYTDVARQDLAGVPCVDDASALPDGTRAQTAVCPSATKPHSIVDRVQSKSGPSHETLKVTGNSIATTGTNSDGSLDVESSPVDRSRFKSLSSFRFSVPPSQRPS